MGCKVKGYTQAFLPSFQVPLQQVEKECVGGASFIRARREAGDLVECIALLSCGESGILADSPGPLGVHRCIRAAGEGVDSR